LPGLEQHCYEVLITPAESGGGARRVGSNCSIIFVYLAPQNAGTSSATLAGWFVDALDQTMDELASRGVVFARYDQPGIKTDDRGVFDGRFRAVWIKDPDGNTVAITENM
jgi:hypothetical protein